MANTATAADPYQPPESDLGDGLESRLYGGIRRRWYVGGFVALTILQGISDFLFVDSDSMALVAGGISLIAVVALTIARLKNIGSHPLWVLLLLVPIANLLLIARCIVVPEGYKDSKRLDTPGKVLTGLILIGLVTLAGLVALDTRSALG